jgi:acetate kinase
MMGSRSGSVDPGLLLHLLRDRGIGPEQLDRVLNQESGLLGVSGVSSDMRAVLAAQTSDPAARLAVEIYLHRLRREIGAMAATLGGLDALVFTAGVGENSAEIRRRACAGLEHLGLRLDPAANAEARPDVDSASSDSPARILIVASREDLTIVRELRPLMRATGGDR